MSADPRNNPEREESMNLIVALFQLKNETIEKKVSIYGAQAAFFLQLSAIPFVMAILNIFQFISPSVLNELLELLNRIGTPAISDILSRVINELYVQSNGALISVSLLSALWSSSKGVYAIEQGLNEIYGNDKEQGFVKARFISLFYMIMLILVLLLTIIVLMFGSSIQNLIGSFFPPLYHVINLFPFPLFVKGVDGAGHLFVWSRLIHDAHKQVAVDERVDSAVDQAVIDFIAWVCLHAGAERDHGNLFHARLFQRAADKSDIVRRAAAPPCLGDDDGSPVEIVLAG